MNLITERMATIGLLTILSLVVIFHVLVMLRIIPMEIVWGGRLKDSSQMLSFEAISITINLIMLAIVSIHAGFFNGNKNRPLVTIALWAMAALFLINTIGNLFSNNQLEKIVFTPVTLLLAMFSLRLALSKKPAN